MITHDQMSGWTMQPLSPGASVMGPVWVPFARAPAPPPSGPPISFLEASNILTAAGTRMAPVAKPMLFGAPPAPAALVLAAPSSGPSMTTIAIGLAVAAGAAFYFLRK